MSQEASELKRVIGDFVAWADDYPPENRSGEWEADYARWAEITTAYCKFLDAYAPDHWDDEIIDLLLFVLARDNEMEVLKDELCQRPDHLLALAKAGIHSTERDARWQLADALGDARLEASAAEQKLEQYLEDSDEYVRRRALLAMARRHASRAEAYAVRAWDTGEEYQRMAAIEVLATIGSALLPSYLMMADADGREFLTIYVKELRHGL